MHCWRIGFHFGTELRFHRGHALAAAPQTPMIIVSTPVTPLARRKCRATETFSDTRSKSAISMLEVEEPKPMTEQR